MPTFYPSSIALDVNGNIYIADKINNKISKISSSGKFSTVTASSLHGFSGDSKQAKTFQLSEPMSITTDRLGNLYVADSLNHRILKVDTSGKFTTVPDKSRTEHGPETNSEKNLELNYPSAVTVDTNGNIYIIDNINRLIKVDASGNFSIMSIPVVQYLTSVTSDSKNNIYLSTASQPDVFHAFNSIIYKLDPLGKTINTMEIDNAYISSFAIDNKGNIFAADTALSVVFRIDACDL